MKKGITMSILAITVVIMLILVSAATIVGTQSIRTANYEEFLSKIKRVSDDINSYIIENNIQPMTGDIVAKTGLPNSLLAEITNKEDDYNNLYIIDMNKLKTVNVNIGYGSISNMDIFLVSENTNNVYYYKGFKYKGSIYHGIQN